MFDHIPAHLTAEWEVFLAARALGVPLGEALYLDHAEINRALSFTGILNHYGA